MNLKMVGQYLGHLLLAEAVFLFPAALVGVIYGETRAVWATLAAMALCCAAGFALHLLCRGARAVIYAREGFVVAGAGWLAVSLLGALPFIISGEIPHFFDAFFETASGFTTTGASVMADVEAMSHCMLFWRSFTHWLGGIGVLAFVLAVVRAKAGAGFTLHLLRAEAPGPQVGKTLPKVRDNVRILLIIYVALSALNLAALLVGGMPWFDALCTMFGTAGTGGFGIKNSSLADYSVFLQNVTTVFMWVFGANFALYQLILNKEWRSALKDEELRLYLIIIAAAVTAISVDLRMNHAGSSLGQDIQQSAFTVSSIMSTTGYAVSDFNLWPEFSRALILILMIGGAMAGSTAGGFKMVRLVILLKSVRAGLNRLLHPRSVRAVRINGRVLDDEVMGRTQLFLVIYCALVLAIWLFISKDGFSLETNIAAALSCFNNVGPALGLAGPSANYGIYSNASKLVLTFAMLLGRLEIFPILLLFSPATWSRKT